MTYVKVGDIKIGEGVPKICVPIVGSTKEEILQATDNFKDTKIDVVEWRCDFFEEVFDENKVADVLMALRQHLSHIPLLMTFRTSQEGGEKEITSEKYMSLLEFVMKRQLVDLVDVELFMGDAIVKEIVKIAHQNQVIVIGSNHDFHKTPAQQEIVARLCQMQELGVDIAKIAVMPTNKKDVLTLLSATLEMHTHHDQTPIITMSMSQTGLISRLCGEVFGSALTFGAIGKTSAPGQMNAQDLETILSLIHKSL